ncbi:MAG: acetyl-CoA carboxylase carboxyl transferase subunit alpha [Candidatus Omnitrophica bacterium CG_4_9_14_0_2_um_filter_42_8]|nr:MAG: acetyl-CoA carboxylase carboxyl transferase subunit alpha [Candidatus Omnitrophica bacterium CG22_combo_CG10-13_8_21_14_all_43_16]PJC48490.1 MAG: acetyl-CoA carboxylase carboxyl transferase subunit alpha [Candidatus Omnitrophica bacterium CG_4_9_14_0_2_um_filter_42_8]
MSSIVLDFERPILELERKINELKSLASDGSIDLEGEIKTLEARLEKLKKEVFESLTPWQRVQIARHPKRPYTMDYINMTMLDFVEVHGDRMFSDDKAMIGGFAKIDGEKVLVLGHQKGRDTKENIMRSFGSAHPEGYRKAMRLMELANKFNIPIVTFIDTPGAYPGIGAEERGQANSIAYNLREMMLLKVPIIVVVIGEGGSGGALGIGVGDRVYVMENAYYSVISPEGCAAILWKDRLKAPEAAEVLKLTAKDLLGLGLIDEEIPEPLGGAHRDPEKAAQNIKKVIKKALKELKSIPERELLRLRYEKFRKMGSVS